LAGKVTLIQWKTRPSTV